MKAGVLRFTIYGQLCLYIGLVVAFLLKPAGLAANDGISYYGIFVRTLIPYLIALFGAAWCYWLAANHIEARELKPLRLGLRAAALLAVIIAITPYSINSLTDWTHMTAGAALFIVQLVLSGWLIVTTRYNPIITLLGTAELGTGIACAVYLRQSAGLLLQCQVLFQLAFAGLFIYILSKPKTLSQD